MSEIPHYLRIPFRPQATSSAVVTAGEARFAVLTSRLIRLEYAANGRFVDQPSQIFWYRQQPVPDFEVKQEDGRLTITTAYLHLSYSGGPFTVDSLTIRQLETAENDPFIWRYGDEDAQNLRGTARTLDGTSGSTGLEPGLISRSGWAVVDDSYSLLFTKEGWLEPRPQESGLDLYFFGYGRDYQACLRDFARLTGPTPLLPRWALGNWWSRYWAYTQEELLQLMRDFRDHQAPLSVCVVDMDWHITEVDYEGVDWPWTSGGWTGYTWNRDLFPEPEEFVQTLHELGLKTALNLHPADGVWPHEAAYPAMARRLGLDPEEGGPIPFAITDPAFAGAYFEELHHPLEAQGIDFWWLDWQQGEASGLAGLDPLWWLNHLHYYDLGRDGQKRPFIFSRWGGLGNHRYPIGFSGDTYVDWETLAFQPYFTATAANVGYGWWSHDIGGHMKGLPEPELYLRWVQFGVFSPIFRFHSTKNRFLERRPWRYDAEIFRITRDAMQLRHALIPYLYSMARRNVDTGQPPVRPLYHEYPDAEAAYHCPQQYAFGSELIAAPYTAPADPDTRLSRQVIWLPPGEWFHFFSGESFAGGGWYALYGRLDDIPVFARAGAIVPLGPKVGWGGTGNPATIDLHLFPGADNRFNLYEDDGETIAYREGAAAVTGIAQQWREEVWQVTVTAVSGDARYVPPERQYRLYLHGIAPGVQINLLVGGEDFACATAYEEEIETLRIGPIPLPSDADLRLTVQNGVGPLRSRRDRSRERCLALLDAFRLDTLAKQELATRMDAWLADTAGLAPFALNLAPSQMRALLEVTQQAGVHRITGIYEADLVLLWNNGGETAVSYRLAQLDETKWDPELRYQTEGGPLPRFRALYLGAPATGDGLVVVDVARPEWQLRVNYGDLLTVTLPD